MTRLCWPGRRARRALAVQAVLASALVFTPVGAAAAPAPAAAATPCVSMTGIPISSPSTGGSLLSGVKVRSPCDAWAVGQLITPDGGNGLSLVMHWDGARWTQVPSQSPGDTQNWLIAVTATSATNAWAVGFREHPTQTLIERWDGTSWTQVDSPSPGTEDRLWGVAATSATNAWAVGSFTPAGGTEQTLIEHWDGTSWTQVPSPSPGTLFGVIGIGWAVGYAFPGPQAIIEHWDGRKWSVVTGADLGPGTNCLLAVSATSPTNIWAVGGSGLCNGDSQMLIEHYDGTSWTQVTSPGPGTLTGVSATGASDAWAVGQGPQGARGLIAHYDGTSWTAVPNDSAVALVAVSASSPANVWAVAARRSDPKHFDPVALHLRCC